MWIRTSAEVAHLVASLEGCRAVALDTEADSLHHYREKVCLIQLATDAGQAYLIDPLTGCDLAPLGGLFADPKVTKVFHGADYDVVGLKRDFSFRVPSLFDTMIAARFLGLREIGLGAVVRSEFGVLLSKSSQKDDWSRRPLTAIQEDYALSDVRHLLPLQQRFENRLRCLNRLAWLQEECAAVAAIEPSRRDRDAEAYRHVKGSGRLSSRGLAVLRELVRWREERAMARDVPPFKVLEPRVLLLLASNPPRSLDALGRIGPFPSRLKASASEAFDAISRALAAPESQLPRRATASRPTVSAECGQRIKTLRAWRAEEADRLGLEAALVLPQRLLEAVAAAAPRSLEDLARIEGLRRWRTETFGEGILAALS